jgi:hypothetical protein
MQYKRPFFRIDGSLRGGETRVNSEWIRREAEVELIPMLPWERPIKWSVCQGKIRHLRVLPRSV